MSGIMAFQRDTVVFVFFDTLTSAIHDDRTGGIPKSTDQPAKPLHRQYPLDPVLFYRIVY
jgi:hypothetical protein